MVERAIQSHADFAVELPRGPDDFGCGKAEVCRETLSRAGFEPASLVFRTVTEEWQVPTASFVFEGEREAGVRTTALLAAQKPEVLSAIRARSRAHCGRTP